VVVDIKQHKSQFKNSNFTITQSAKFFWHCAIAPKWLEVDQNNLHMKFSALNVNFSNLSLDPLGSMRPAHVGVK